MKTQSIQVRLDRDTKKRVEKILARIGVDVPTAVRIFFMKVVATGGIPFDLQQYPEDNYSPKQLAKLDRLAAQAKAGKGLSRPFNTAEELLEELHRKL